VNRLATLTLLLGAVACTTDGDGPVWELVWQDIFAGKQSAPPSARSWSYDIGRGANGWGNDELQYYTDRVENIGQTGDGDLRITMRREEPDQVQFEGAGWTSARIVTKDKFSFRYGKIEALIRTPVRTAVWPAFWMLGSDIDESGWPNAGEIDIMEVFGRRAVGHALHGRWYSGGEGVGHTYLQSDELDGYADAFHKYEMIWDPQQIIFMIDDEITWVATPADLPPGAGWAFDHEFYLLLNMAVGGNPVEPVGPGTPDSASMLIDHIKVWQRREPLLDPLPWSPPEPEDAGTVE